MRRKNFEKQKKVNRTNNNNDNNNNDNNNNNNEIMEPEAKKRKTVKGRSSFQIERDEIDSW